MGGVAANAAGGLRAFFSAAGYCSPPRFAVIALLSGGILWACSWADYTYGQFLNIVAGVIAGAAVGKFGVEAVRRMRDAGIHLSVVSRVLLALGVVFSILLAGAGSAWADVGIRVLFYGLVTAAALVLFLPRRPHVVEPSIGSWRGPVFAAVCIIGGAFVVGGIAYISIGMEEQSKRVEAWRAAHDQEGNR